MSEPGIEEADADMRAHPVTAVQLDQGTLEAIASMVATQLRQSGEF